MSLVPRLPETAPFSPAQRAWLDGYIAGVMSGSGDPSPAMLGASALPAGATPVPDEDEGELPWHDPILGLDERLELAAGRRTEHILMAAMAQLDCGQCGYLCQSYAAAIALGTEPSLSRCVPGGKATSRALKALLAEAGSPAAPRTTVSAAAPVTVCIAEADPGAHFAARLMQAPSLHGSGAEKDTRHVVLEAIEGDAPYQVGDSLGVVANNSPDLVGAIIERLGTSAETLVQSPDGVERPLAEALAHCCEIRRPSDQAIEVLASRAIDREESRVLQAMAEGYPGAGPQDADLLDLLDAFPSARPPLSELISALDPLLPRLYSIASSPKKSAREIHLAVAVVRYRMRDRQRGGVASTFLSDRLSPGGTVSVYVNPSTGFRLPAPTVR